MRKLVIVALMLAVAFEVMAWGGLGHRTVAEIAERNLTPKAKANIERYTGGASLASLSTWMDSKKKPKRENGVCKKWHASVVDSKNRATQEVRDRIRGGNNAVTAALMFTEMFKEREKLSDSTVMFALKCLVHMVGDIHCPSHMRYADINNGRGFDLGVEVYYFDSYQKLHKVYDTSLIASNNPGIKPKDYAEKLDTYTKKQIREVTEGWIERWHEDAARDIRVAVPWVKHGDELYEAFDEKALPLAEMELRKAGYRLAKLLNVLFG
jgi:hypothetical protein